MEYGKCLVQVYEILNQLDDEELEKIPEDVIKNIELKKDKRYIWKYDETKRLEEQEIDRKTAAIIAYINIEYLLSEEEKERIKEIHKENENKLFPKIGTINFSNSINYEEQEERENENINNALIKSSECKWYQKIFAFFRKIFNK